MNSAYPWLVAAFLLFGVRVATSDSVVTKCSYDTEPGPGNLTDALQAGGRIQFACGDSAIIKITRTHVISKELTINGENRITLDREGGFGFLLGGSPAVRITLANVKLRNGRFPVRPVLGRITGTLVGGEATLILDSAHIEQADSPIDINIGQIEVRNSTFFENRSSVLSAKNVTISGSQFENPGAEPVVLTFGAVGAPASLFIDDSSFSANAAVHALSNGSGTCRVEIQRSTFASGGDATKPGGALNTGCDTVIAHTTFIGNRGSAGGAIFLSKNVLIADFRRVQFRDNKADQAGGAVAMESSETPRSLRISYGTFTNNQAEDGGAIDLGPAIENAATLIGTSVLFSGNTATRYGGAIHGTNANVTLSESFFIGNAAASWGGGIAIEAYAPRTLSLGNVLLVRNEAPAGSALHVPAADLINVTLADNAARPLTAFAPFPAPWHRFRLLNTIVSGLESGACSGARVDDAGNNIQWPDGGCGARFMTANPMLDGHYVPIAGSPALNNGNNSACLTTPVDGVDVFGQKRPQNARCTIGAVEYHIEQLVPLRRRDQLQR